MIKLNVFLILRITVCLVRFLSLEEGDACTCHRRFGKNVPPTHSIDAEMKDWKMFSSSPIVAFATVVAEIFFVVSYVGYRIKVIKLAKQHYNAVGYLV